MPAPRPSSIRSRLSLRLGLAVAAAGALTFGGLYALGRAERIASFDAALEDDFRSIANITQVHPGDDIYVDVQPEILTAFLERGDKYFLLWSIDGRDLIDASRSMGDASTLEIARPTWANDGAPEASPQDWTLPNGRQVRALARRIDAQWSLDAAALERRKQRIGDVQLDLLVARERAPLDASLRHLALACAAGALLLPLIAVGMVHSATRRALAPLDALTAATARRTSQDAAAFEATGVRELEPIVTQLNALLERIHQAWRRERRFLADAAHELRTPLAELHTVAQVALLEGPDAHAMPSQEHVDALRDVQQVVRRMDRLLDALFKLARQDHLRESLRPQPLDLLELVHEVSHAQDAPARERQLRWRMPAPPAGCVVQADRSVLRALLDNLAGNAVAHAPAGAELRWELQGTAPPVLALLNEAPSLRPEDLERFFEPFWQRAGHADDCHAGLGLALARAYAEAMGLELQALLRSAPPGPWLELRLAWPGAAEAA